MAIAIALDGSISSCQAIIIWLTIARLALAKFGYFGNNFVSIDTNNAISNVISRIMTKEAVLAPATVVPHLTYHLGLNVNPSFIDNLLWRLEQTPEFRLDFHADDLYLFSQTDDRK